MTRRRRVDGAGTNVTGLTARRGQVRDLAGVGTGPSLAMYRIAMCPPVPEIVTALVVEDDAIVLTACTELLTGFGMRVRSAASRGAALSALASGDVDVVIANVRLPDTTGAELLQAIRERDAAVPVIFVSAWPAFGREDGAALGGAIATAADSYRIGQRARRRSCSPLQGES